MKYITLNIIGTSIQFHRKLIRKIGSITRRRDTQTDFYFLSNLIFSSLSYENKSEFKIIICKKPPYEAFMFFPLGKRPDMNESCCFVAYKGKKMAGWGWLHKGLRADADIPHNIKCQDYLLWFGPDYVKPKFRGMSLQKALIYERLLYVQSEFSPDSKCVTIIGRENYPSRKSYSFFKFKNINNNDISDI